MQEGADQNANGVVTTNNMPQVEQANGKNIFVWTGSMTGCQSKVAVLEEFAKLNPGSAITVIFNSTGGGVDDCRESYNRMLMLRTFYRMHFTFVVLQAKSCALWFIQCADVRIALPHSALMYHGVKWTLEGAKDQRELEEARLAMDKNQTEFTEILCSRSADATKTIQDVLKRISDGRDHIITPNEAMEYGWFDQIHKPKFVPVQGEIDLTGLTIPAQVY